jgi:hypothetical protein
VLDRAQLSVRDETCLSLCPYLPRMPSSPLALTIIHVATDIQGRG